MNDFIVQLIARLDATKVSGDIKKIEEQLKSKGIKLKPVIDSSVTKQELQNLSVELQSILKKSGLNIDTSKILSSINQIITETNKVEKAIVSYTNKLNDFKTKYSEASIDYSSFEKVFTQFKNGEKTLNELSVAWNRLNNTAKQGTQNLKSKSSSFDPIQQTLNDMRNLPSNLTSLEKSMSSLKDKSSLAGVSIKDLMTEYEGLKNEMSQSNGKVPLTDDWTLRYRTLMETVQSLTKQVETLKKVEASDNSQVTKQANYYSTILSNYRQIYSLKQKLLTAGKEEEKIIKEQLRSLRASNAATYKQLSSHGLKDKGWQSQVNDFKKSAEYSLRAAEARQKDKQATADAINAEKQRQANLKESNNIIKELEKSYNNISKLQIKKSTLDPSVDSEKITKLSQEIALAKREYDALLSSYSKNKNFDNSAWKNVKSDIDAATKSAIEYNNASKTDYINKQKESFSINLAALKTSLIESGTYTDELKQKISLLESELEKVSNKGDLSTFKNNLKSIQTEISSLTLANKIQLKVDSGDSESRVEALIAKTNQWTDVNGNARISTTSLSQALNELTAASEAYRNNNTGETQKRLITANEKLTEEYNKVTSAVRRMNATYAKDTDIASLHNKIGDFIGKNGDIIKHLGTDLNAMFSQTAKGSQITTQELAALEQKFISVKNVANQIQMANAIHLKIETGESESKVAALIDKTKQWTDVNGNARISTSNLSSALHELVTASNEYAGNKTETAQKKLIASNEKLDAEYKKVANSIRQTNAELAKDSAVASLHNKVSEFMGKNGKAVKYYGTQLKDIFDKTAQGSEVSKQKLAQLNQEFIKLQNTARANGKLGKTFFQTIREGMSSFSYWTSSTFMVMKAIQSVKSGISTIKELDTALVDLKKTTTMTASELEEFYYDANETAKEMGVTTQQIIEQASAWSRLGFSSADAATKMAKYSSMFKTISPGMDLDSATDGLVSIMKAFKIGLDDSDEVVDGIMSKINVIGNSKALNNSDIVEFLRRSSSAMAEANNSLEETIALGEAAVEITRDASNTGQVLKTTSMRIRGYDEEAQSYTEELGNLKGEIADLTKTAKTPGGISLFTDDTKETYKSTYKIIEEISEIWDDLTDKNQANNMCLYVQKCA